LPRVIVSDQDLKFTNSFWMHFAKKVGMKPKFSTAFHSQMLGIPEHVNGVLTNT
jgi:hypothetical protein